MLLYKAAMIVMAGWGIGSVVAVSANCAVGHLWQLQDHGTCNGTTRWLAITVLDSATEILVMAMVVWLVSRLQMTTMKKVEVCSAFAWRLGSA